MRTISSITVAALLAAGLGAAPPGRAQAPSGQNDDTHHPDQTPPSRAPAPARPAPSAGMGMGMDGPGGMRGGMPGGEMGRMMQMMRMMQDRGGAADMPFGRIEGLLGYVRAELRITDAQVAAWTAFADAVRAQSDGLRAAMRMAMAEDTRPAPAPAPQQMARRIAFLSAMLEAMRGVAAAAGPLYAVLSEAQRRTADDLMAEHFRAMRMGMP